jgi:hypothetical protein
MIKNESVNVNTPFKSEQIYLDLPDLPTLFEGIA